MEKTGITHLAAKDFNRMSGGELQMVLIARALINEPKLIILDEPETGLDFHNQILVLNMVEKLAHEDGISAIMNGGNNYGLKRKGKTGDQGSSDTGTGLH